MSGDASAPVDVTRGSGIFSARYRRLSAGLFSLVLMIAFEAMAVATAMPAAAGELGGLDLYAWAFTGFLTASLFAMATAGEVCDRLGPRLPLVVGVAAFAVGLMVAGSAPTMPVFVLGRLVQGLGGGTVIVALYVAVGVFPDHLRPRVFSAMAACWVLPSVVGPPVAGLLTEYLSWRWVFWGLLPFVAAPLLMILPSLVGLRGNGRQQRWSLVALALALAGGVGVLQYAGQLVQAAESALAWWGAGLLAVLGIAVALPALRRFLPAGTLRLRRGLPSLIAMRGVIAGAFFGAEAFLPLMLVEHRGWSVTFAGFSLTGAALGWATGSWLQGLPTDLDSAQRRTRAARFIFRGAVTTSVGIAVSGLGAVDAGALSLPSLLTPVGWMAGGLGMGLCMSSVSVLLFELSPVAERGFNSAALQISDALGSILVIAGAGLIYSLGRQVLSGSVIFGAVFALAVLVGGAAVIVATRVLPSGMSQRPVGLG